MELKLESLLLMLFTFINALDPFYVPLAAVPSIVGRTFASWPDFFSFWEQFERQHLVVYRTRDCQTTKGYNKSKINHPERQVPESFGYAFRKYVCTLGCKQKSRSTGKRAKRKERYRACKAMFRVAVIRASSGDFSSSSNWTITVTSEVGLIISFVFLSSISLFRMYMSN